MAVIESVAVRQRGSLDFEMYYENLCALSNTCPVAAVKAHLKQNVLDINGDRIRANDWLPILNTIKINKTLEYIAVRSFYQQGMEEKDFRYSAKKLKIPSIRSKELTHRLCRALKDCLEVNSVLRCLELQGLPMRLKDTELLAKGIVKSTSLQHLSFENTCIRDEQLTVLCRVIKNTMCITSVNFSGCSLTWRSAETIAGVIKHQSVERHSEAWKDGLRYRKPYLDRMAGLRRITANSNPLLGDKGVQILADVLKDDIWVKAIDLHHCGIGEEGAKALLEILKFNSALVVLDVRLNPLIGKEMMTNIMDQLCINCKGLETEYKWIKIPRVTELKAKQQRLKKKNKMLQGYGWKAVVRGSSSYLNKRVKSAPSSIARGSLSVSAEYVKPGTPWRTAVRAAHHRGEMPDHSASEIPLFESLNEVSSSLDQMDSARDVGYNQLRDMRMELELLRRSAADEGTSKINLEKKIHLLESENGWLREELKELQAKRSVLEDDRVLDSIEETFAQFNSFLDMLKDIGLGQLVAMAGLDQMSMPFQHDSGLPSRNGKSRLDTTQQMKSFLEQSRLDTSNLSFMSDAQPVDKDPTYHKGSLIRNKLSDSVSSTALSSRHLQNYHHSSLAMDEKLRKTTSRFDELYQKALKNTESILQRKEFQQSHETQMESTRCEESRPMTEVQNPTTEKSKFLLENRKVIKVGDQSSEHSDTLSLTAGKLQNSSNKGSGDGLTTFDTMAEPRILSDHSEKSSSSKGTVASRTKLASTMSDLQDGRQEGSVINELGVNKSYDTVDERTISDESNLEELLLLNDSESQGEGEQKL